MASISRDEVLKLAQLSKLELKDDEVEKFRAELEEIVGYVEQLQKADVTGLKPTDQLSGQVNVTRKDEVKEYASREELLKNLPAEENGQIKVNRIVA